jgi:hypothetical protein
MIRLIPVLTICFALLAGCGGGDDGGSDGGDGASRDEFVADANAICRDGEKKVDEVTGSGRQELQEASSDAERRKVVGDLLEETAQSYDPYLDRLGELEPPEEIADDWSSFLEGINEAFDLIPELADATRENDEQQLSELTARFTQIARDTRPFAERAGLDDCLPDEGTQ